MQQIRKCCSCTYWLRELYSCTHPENHSNFKDENDLFDVRRCGPHFGCIQHVQKEMKPISIYVKIVDPKLKEALNAKTN